MSCRSCFRRTTERLAAALLLATGTVALPAAAQPTAAAMPATPPAAATHAMAAPAATLDARLQALKADVIALNRDLLVLEEELLFPASTQLAVFVSMDVGRLFTLESVQLKIGDEVVATHLYTPLEVQALHRGGMQRLHLGNLKSGAHELVAVFTGRGPAQGDHQRDYKRGTTLRFEKTHGAKAIELRITDAQARLQPEFEVKVWP